jgi:hypothetical protein
MQLLAEAVAELRGRPIEQPKELKLEVPVDAHLPAADAPREPLRLEAHHHPGGARVVEEVESPAAAPADRHGSPPRPGRRMHRRGLARLVIGLALLLAACGTDDGASVRQGDGAGTASGGGAASGSGSASQAAKVPCNPVGDAATADTKVEVELLDRDILLGSAQVEAGTVTLEISNNGTELHELVVVRADDPAELPLADDGRVAIGKLPTGAFVGEVEPWSPDLVCTGTFELKVGRYALFCNILQTEADGTRDNHYANGMRAALRVRR